MADEAKRRVSQTTEGQLVILQGLYLSSDPSLSNKDVYPLLLSQDGKLKVISDVESFPSDLLSGNSLAVSASKTIIDGCESITDWSAQDQAGSLTTSTTHTHGTKSLSFAKSGTTGTTGYIDKTITAVDLDVYQTHAILHTNFYISDTSDIVKVFLRIGTDSSNYFQYDHLVADMATGWNDSDHIMTRPTSQTGDGANLASITYIAFGIELSNNTDTLSGILIDNITVKRMLEVLSFAGVAIPPATRRVVITDRNSNNRADVEADGAQYALYIMSNSLASESTLESIKDTDGIKKITDALPAGTSVIGAIRAKGNTAKDGTGTEYFLLVDADGKLSIRPLTSSDVVTAVQATAANLKATVTQAEKDRTIDILKIRGTAPTVVGKLDILSADGDQATIGAIADAIVAAGATGSISAKLRRATQGLEDLKTAIVLAAGTNIIGYVKDAGVSYTPVHNNDEQTTAQTDTTLWDPTEGNKFVITDIVVSVDTAMTVHIEDGTTKIYEWHFAANGGCVMNLKTSYVSTAANNNLTYTSSAAGKVSIAVDGYEE